MIIVVFSLPFMQYINLHIFSTLKESKIPGEIYSMYVVCRINTWKEELLCSP